MSKDPLVIDDPYFNVYKRESPPFIFGSWHELEIGQRLLLNGQIFVVMRKWTIPQLKELEIQKLKENPGSTFVYENSAYYYEIVTD